MAIVTIVVVRKWSLQQSKLDQITEFKELVQNYKTVGRVVSSLNNIFREWFVCQWIIFFIGIAGKGTLFLKSLLHEEYKMEPHRFLYIVVHLLFDIFSFLIPYCLGIIINM